MLPDVLVPGLQLVICGTAASDVSARRGAYYAGPGNKFWSILFEVGLTRRQLEPGEFAALPGFGIGLTDVVKGQAGGDASIDFDRSDPEGLRAKIHRFRPAILAFNGKKAAQVFLAARRVDYGPHTSKVGPTRLFVAPSTSGAASGFWNAEFWYELAAVTRETIG